MQTIVKLKQQAWFLLFLTISSFISQPRAQSCFKFPTFMGSSQYYSLYYTMDMDSSLNVLVGGRTQGNDIAGTTWNTPIIAYYTPSVSTITGPVWAKMYQQNGLDLTSVVRILSSTQAVAIFSDQNYQDPFVIAVVSISTGSLIMSYVQNTDGGQFFAENLYVLSSTQFLLGFQDYSSYLCIAMFTVGASTLTLNQGIRYTKYQWQAESVTSDGTYVYIGSTSNYLGNQYWNPYGIITAILLSTFSHRYHFYIYQPNISVPKIVTATFGGTPYLYLTMDWNFLKYYRMDMTNADSSGGTNIPQTNAYYSSTCQYYILALAVQSFDIVASLFQNCRGQNQMLFVDFSTSQGTITHIKPTYDGSNQINVQTGMYDSSASTLYYVGWTYKFYQSGSVVASFNPAIAFLTNTDITTANSCINDVSSQTTISMSYDSTGFQISDNTPNSFPYSYNSNSITLLDLVSTTIISNTWCDQVTITAPSSMTNYNYALYSGASSWTLPSFITRTCPGFVTTNTLTSTPTLPGSVTFDGQFALGINSNNYQDAGVYTVTLTETSPTDSTITASKPFTLTVTDICTTATYTATAQPTLTYYINQPIQTINLNAFTTNVNNVNCGKFIYQVTDSSNAPLSNGVSYLSGSFQLTVYSQVPSLIGTTYTVKIKGWQPHYPSLAVSANFVITFACNCIYDVMTAPSDTYYPNYLLGSATPFSPGTFSSFLPPCQTYSYTCKDINGLTYTNSASQAYQIVTALSQSNGDVIINTPLPPIAILTVKITATNPSGLTATTTMVVQVVNCNNDVLTTQSFIDLTYIITKPAIVIKFLSWTNKYKIACGTLVYTMAINQVWTPSNGYISFDSKTLTITIYATDALAIGTYNVEIQGQLNAMAKLKASSSFFASIVSDNTGPPYFVTPLDDVILTYPEIYMYKFPQVADPDPADSPTYTVNLGKAAVFCEPQGDQILIRSNKLFIGTFTVFVQMTDNDPVPKFTSYTFKITINPMPVVQPPSEQQLLLSSQFGAINGSYYLDGQRIPTNLTQDMTAYISSVSTTGVATVVFSKPLIQYRDLDYIYNYMYNLSALDVVLVPYERSSKNKVTNWRVTNLGLYQMTLQLKFLEPQFVSLNQYDKIYVRFRTPYFFVSQTFTSTLAINYTTNRKDVPPQIYDSVELQRLQKVGEIASILIFVLYALIIILAFYLDVSLKRLWIVLNTFQLVVSLPLNGFVYPINYLVTAQALFDIASLNVIPREAIQKINAAFMPSTGLNNGTGTQFQQMNFNSDDLAQNLSLMFFAIVLGGIIAPILIGLFYAQQKLSLRYDSTFIVYRWSNLVGKVLKLVFFNYFLRTLMIGHLNFSISTLFSIQTGIDDMSQILPSFLIAFVLFVLPALTFGILYTYQPNLENKQNRDRFGSLYMNLNLDTQSLLYTSLFFGRRLLFAASAVYMGTYPVFQVQLQIFMSFGMIYFIFYVRPFMNRSVFALEIVNELHYLVICYCSIPFALNVFNEITLNLKDTIGKACVVTVYLNVLINMMVLMAENGTVIKERLRRFMYIRNAKAVAKFKMQQISSFSTNLRSIQAREAPRMNNFLTIHEQVLQSLNTNNSLIKQQIPSDKSLNDMELQDIEDFKKHQVKIQKKQYPDPGMTQMSYHPRRRRQKPDYLTLYN